MNKPTADHIRNNNITELLAKNGRSVYEIKLIFSKKPEQFVVYYDGDVFDGYEYSTLEEFLDNWDQDLYGTLRYADYE